MKKAKFLSLFCAAAMIVSAGALNVCAAAENDTALAAESEAEAVEEEITEAPVFGEGVWELSMGGKAVLYLVFTSPTEGRTESAAGYGGTPFTCEQDGFDMVFHFGSADDNTPAKCSEGDAEITFTMDGGTELTYQIDYIPCDDPASFTVEVSDADTEGLIDLADARLEIDTANQKVNVYVDGELIPESAYTVRYFFHMYTDNGETLSLSGTDYPNQPGTYIATITPNAGYTGEARSDEFTVRSAANGGDTTEPNPHTGTEGFAASLVLAGMFGAAAFGAMKLRRK